MTISRGFYILLLFIASWSVYYLMDKDVKSESQVTPNMELPLFSGQQLHNISYNENGLRSYIITSKSLDHYAQSGDTVFNNPVLQIFKQGTELEWEIKAKKGTLTKEQVLTLNDDVLATNLLEDAGFKLLSTAQMNIQLDNRDFWTDNTVFLMGPQFETTGNAMKGNFAENNAILYNEVQGRYETLTP